tara:strand:+ start:415 stop:921 length:507 start_codon:yes stop_codon:yes gene_type:complete
MAAVNIYAIHDQVANYIISAKQPTKSVIGRADTGPFAHKREAYLFALSMGMKHGAPAQDQEMAEHRKKSLPIKEHTFLKCEGAHELVNALWIHHRYEHSEEVKDMREMLMEIGSDDYTSRFALADRYAFKGFSLLHQLNQDETILTAQDLILRSLASIDEPPEEELIV